MSRLFSVFVLFFVSQLACSQVSFGYFSTNENFSLLKNKYVNKSNTIVLDSLRETSNILTNHFETKFKDYSTVKRKKAVVRHVKHVNEELEFYALNGIKVDSFAFERLAELELLLLSYYDKCKSETKLLPSNKQLIALAKTTKETRKWKFEIVQVTESHSISSPYRSELEKPDHKRFSQLAKSKKIKTEKNMVVLFSELSNSGSAPKIRTEDLDRDNEWSLKWGDEIHSDVFCSRLYASLGYDIDHPYYYGKDRLTLVFDTNISRLSWSNVKDSLFAFYQIDLTPFVSSLGYVDQSMIDSIPGLEYYMGFEFVQFVECAIEARPDRVKRLGSFIDAELGNPDRPELKEVLLLHAFIGNWDTRKENTLLTTNHDGNYHYDVRGVFSDLGTSMGISFSTVPFDFKSSLVNDFSWRVVEKRGKHVILQSPINSVLAPYKNTTYSDLAHMAIQIASLDSLTIRKCLNKANYPPPVEELYFHKLASRRKSIIDAFDIHDPNPIEFDRKLRIVENGTTVVKNGKLRKNYCNHEHPEGLTSHKGRKRNYGH